MQNLNVFIGSPNITIQKQVFRHGWIQVFKLCHQNYLSPLLTFLCVHIVLRQILCLGCQRWPPVAEVYQSFSSTNSTEITPLSCKLNKWPRYQSQLSGLVYGPTHEPIIMFRTMEYFHFPDLIICPSLEKSKMVVVGGWISPNTGMGEGKGVPMSEVVWLVGRSLQGGFALQS